jgi:hypothetical protein
MIRTTIMGYPVVYQNDNSYQLPSVTGTVQWNGNIKKFQVNNGASWMDIDNNITFSSDHKLQKIVEWADKKIREEEEIKNLCLTNPTIADLQKQILEKKEQIDIVRKLTSMEIKIG